MEKEKLIKKYDKQVKMYERHRRNKMLADWRSKLIKHASGRVLEVGVGVGANFPYYDREKVEITGVDFSPKMIQSAKEVASVYQVKANFLEAAVEDLIFEDNSFDCIVSTLSFCSYPDPISVLNQFNRSCRKDGNRIAYGTWPQYQSITFFYAKNN